MKTNRNLSINAISIVLLLICSNAISEVGNLSQDTSRIVRLVGKPNDSSNKSVLVYSRTSEDNYSRILDFTIPTKYSPGTPYISNQGNIIFVRSFIYNPERNGTTAVVIYNRQGKHLANIDINELFTIDQQKSLMGRAGTIVWVCNVWEIDEINQTIEIIDGLNRLLKVNIATGKYQYLNEKVECG